MESINLTVSGMTCGACVKHVEKAISSIAGVRKVEVNLDAGTAKVEGNFADGASPILAALKEDGYPAKVSFDQASKEKAKSSSCKSGTSCCCN